MEIIINSAKANFPLESLAWNGLMKVRLGLVYNGEFLSFIQFILLEDENSEMVILY